MSKRKVSLWLTIFLGIKGLVNNSVIGVFNHFCGFVSGFLFIVGFNKNDFCFAVEIHYFHLIFNHFVVVVVFKRVHCCE